MRADVRTCCEPMSRGRKLLQKMRENPQDWRIEDVLTVCAAFGLTCTPPRKGSHYKVKDERTGRALVVPAHRPIKPAYIRMLVRLLDDAGVQDD